MNEQNHCDSCGHHYPAEELTEFDGAWLCGECMESATTTCSCCGERIWVDDNAGDVNTPLCQSCFDRYYTICARCGRAIHNNNVFYLEAEDDEDGYCYECYSRLSREKGIHAYGYKPTPIFYGDGPRFFRVELEIDEAGESQDNASYLLHVANETAEHLYCKHDGSLNDGFELVTHPMTLDYHQSRMPWAEVLREAVGMGYLSHQAGTCGLHVHVNRSAFGDTAEQQDGAIARVLYFFERHWAELLQFSRRSQRQLDQWAARYGYKDQPQAILEHAKRGRHAGRYTAVNLQNRDTIEFRIFRGALKLNTLLATLQLLDKICDVAIYLSDAEVKALSWTTFVSGCTAPELVQYLKERRLYVNEPVAAESEV